MKCFRPIICSHFIRIGKLITSVNRAGVQLVVSHIIVIYPKSVIRKSFLSFSNDRFGIKELKNDFSIDDFVTHNFWATEACGSFIVMAYNFMSLFRHALINSNKKKFLKTIRYELLSTPAYLGRTKDKHILYLARSLKTRQSFLSIWKKLKDFSLPYDTEKS